MTYGDCHSLGPLPRTLFLSPVRLRRHQANPELASLFVVPSATVASATTAPSCAPKELTVTAGAWAYNPSTAGTVFQSLPITISNEGGTCNIGGFPKIVPTGIKVTHKPNGEAVYALVEGVAISSTKYKMLTLRHGKAAYTQIGRA